MIHNRAMPAAVLAATVVGCAAGTPSTPAAKAPVPTTAAHDTSKFEDLGSVLVFASEADGNVAPIRAIRGPNTGLRLPQDVAVDQQGFVYATNFQRSRASDDTVRVFGPDADGDVIPSRILAGPHTGLTRPISLAFDRKDRLYVATLAMSQGSDSNGVLVYDSRPTGDATPRTTLVGASLADGMTLPTRIAIGRGDSIYVKWIGPLAIYAPGATGASEPRRTIIWYTKGPQFRTSHAPRVFVLDPHDTMYVATGDSVIVYAPGFSGTEPPVRQITGPNSRVHDVSGIALDSRGWLYIVERDSSLIKVYAPGASGDVPPVRTIGGPRTTLSVPMGIVLDEAHRLYVANGPRIRAAVIRFVPGERGKEPASVR